MQHLYRLALSLSIFCPSIPLPKHENHPHTILENFVKSKEMGHEKGNSIFMQKPIDSHLRFMIRGHCLEELLGYGKVTSLYRSRPEERWQMPQVMLNLPHTPES